MNWFEAIILALIEGLTEFLPVSSTGHMILGSAAMGVENDDFTKLFMIVIQLGAILAVFVLYFKRFFQSVQFYLKLIVAFIPAAVLGVLLSDYIDELLESPMAVGISLLIGGIILLFVDKWFNKPTVLEEEKVTYLTALKIGFFQCIAMIPGVSRSAATIIGGITQGLSKRQAAEFSFFLGIPVLMGAGLLDMYKMRHELHSNDMAILAVGIIVAFVSALIVIRALIRYVSKHDFTAFAYYRIVFGLFILATWWTGWVHW